MIMESMLSYLLVFFFRYACHHYMGTILCEGTNCVKIIEL